MAGALSGLAINSLSGSIPALDLLVRYGIEPLGKIFVRLLLMLVIPIVFSALVNGIGELDFRQLKRLGLRTLGYTLGVSVIASLIGIGLVNWQRPGEGFPEALRRDVQSTVNAATLPSNASALDLIIGIVPTNPVSAAASGDMIGVIFFSALFGIGLAQVKSQGAETLRGMVQG